MNILWASPLPPTRSGVSDYSVELLDELRNHAVVRVVEPIGWSASDAWPFGDEVPVVPSDTGPLAGEINLVHLGNNPYHEWLLSRLNMPRTVVVLHDLVLHHLLVECTLGRGEVERYRELIETAHGHAGLSLARARQVGVTGRRDPFLYPARKSFLTDLKGVVVHSREGIRSVEHDLPSIPARRVGLAVADPGGVDRSAVRELLGFPPETVLIMHLGFLTAEKGMLEILTSLAAALNEGIQAHLVVVGEGVERSRLDLAVEELGLGVHVSFTGWTTPEDFVKLPAAADLGVVLRTPSAGETSAAAVRFLACGTPVAVTGMRQFLEWPEAAAPRITPGPSSAADLTRLIEEVARGGAQWRERRIAARRVYEAEHRPVDVAPRFVKALEEIIESSSG